MQASGELLQEARDSFEVVDLGCRRTREVPVALSRYLRTRKPNALLAAMWPMTVAAPIGRLLSGHPCRLAISEHCCLTAQYQDWGGKHLAALRMSMAIGYRMVDATIAVSTGVAEDLARLSGLSASRFHVIHNPVSPRPEPSPDAIGMAEGLWSAPAGARVLTVGRFKSQKNHTLLLRAFARLECADARLMLLGNGDLEPELRSLAAGLGIGDRVIFAGFHADPTPFYRTADLFVLSSDYEGFGNVIVEALANGVPVVSTDCPSGPAEILSNGEFGTLVPVGDAQALALAIEGALAAPHDRERLRARARDFAPEKAAKAYLELLFPPA